MYADEYYNNTYEFWTCQAVTLITAQQLSGIDFSLAPAGTVSGTVKNTDGAPLSGILVACSLITNAGETWGVFTDSQGNYTVYGIPYGQYYVHSMDTNNNYCLEYYQEVSRISFSTPVTVGAASYPTGIDFTMSAGGSISGTIVSKTTSEPVPYVHIDVVDYFTGEWVGCGDTDINGNYTVHGIPAGRYRVIASTTLNGLPYVSVYYINSTGLDGAAFVYVTVGADTSNINFSLTPTG
jgi:hypothetical protein